MTTQEKMNAIATVFNAKSGKKTYRRCGGKWFGTVDYSIEFDNGEKLFAGNSGYGKKFDALVSETYQDYNPETVQQCKMIALDTLKKRAHLDNDLAKKLGKTPYEVMSVELITTDNYGYIGWYYVALKVGHVIVKHQDTGLNYDILKQRLPETIKPVYYVAGGLQEEEVDYIFNGVGFSTKSPMYKVRNELAFYKNPTRYRNQRFRTGTREP